MNNLNWVLFSLLVVMSTSATAAEVPCAVIVKVEPGFQITSQKGEMKTNAKVEDAIECGSIISTHEGTAWIKTRAQVTLKFGPGTYFEFNKFDSAKEQFTLHRGRLLLQSPPQKKTTVIFTPQSEVNFTGGVAWVEYLADKKTTQVASFNKSVSIQNRFNSDAVQTVRAGEMSGMDFSDPRIVPKQPRVMNSATASELLATLKIKDDERNEMVEVVDRVYEERSHSLDAELDGWKDIAKTQEEGRSFGSETKKDDKMTAKESIETIQEREAAYVLEQFKKKVYGGLVDETAVAPSPERVPASVKPVATHAKPAKIKDTEFERQQKAEAEEKRKVLQKISNTEE